MADGEARCRARSTWASRPRAEAGARGGARPRRWPARSASPSGRSRSRCGRRSPASTPATGSIPTGETRDVTVRLAPEARQRATRPRSSCRCRARRRTARRRTLPLGQMRDDHAGPRAGADRPPRPRPGDHGRGEHAGRSLERGDGRRSRRELASAAAARRATHHAGRRGEDQAEVFGRIFAALGVAVLLMYLDPGGAVRLVPRSAGDPALAAAVADRRRAGAADHAATR